MNQTMKAAVVHAFGQPLRIEEVKTPLPGPGQILVKIEASGVCHTDLHAAEGDWPVKPNPPFIPGHEGVGYVAKLGSGEVNRPLPWDSLTAEQRRFQATKMAIHAAMVDRMDAEIGRIIAQLKAMGAYENTLILFASDNGASAEIRVPVMNVPISSTVTFASGLAILTSP